MQFEECQSDTEGVGLGREARRHRQQNESPALRHNQKGAEGRVTFCGSIQFKREDGSFDR
jgi:hypothetical protein